MLHLIEEAQKSGARLEKACKLLGIGIRTIQRWRRQEDGVGDRRRGPRSTPSNKLSAEEREEVLETLNAPRFRDLPPSQVVPLLADEGRYLASEATMYRILRDERQLVHREASRPREHQRPREHRATGPNQVWSWDITYLRGPVRGTFYYLYLFVDVWSRKIVGAEVYDEECNEKAATLFQSICHDENLDPDQLVLHSDNGGPMKGSTMKATLEELGVIPSLNRPRVSNDNPYSESLFRTLKYRPSYPEGAFESLGQARLWVRSFIGWYNHEHLHSGIGFVTPYCRHHGDDRRILERRRAVYRRARRRHPERFAGGTRQWSRPETVLLNPAKATHQETQKAA